MPRTCTCTRFESECEQSSSSMLAGLHLRTSTTTRRLLPHQHSIRQHSPRLHLKASQHTATPCLPLRFISALHQHSARFQPLRPNTKPAPPLHQRSSLTHQFKPSQHTPSQPLRQSSSAINSSALSKAPAKAHRSAIAVLVASRFPSLSCQYQSDLAGSSNLQGCWQRVCVGVSERASERVSEWVRWVSE